jgi:hypothetical protein
MTPLLQRCSCARLLPRAFDWTGLPNMLPLLHFLLVVPDLRRCCLDRVL